MDLSEFTELRESDIYRAKIDVSVPPCDCEYEVVTQLTETSGTPQVSFGLKVLTFASALWFFHTDLDCSDSMQFYCRCISVGVGTSVHFHTKKRNNAFGDSWSQIIQLFHGPLRHSRWYVFLIL